MSAAYHVLDVTCLVALLLMLCGFFGIRIGRLPASLLRFAGGLLIALTNLIAGVLALDKGGIFNIMLAVWLLYNMFGNWPRDRDRVQKLIGAKARAVRDTMVARMPRPVPSAS